MCQNELTLVSVD